MGLAGPGLGARKENPWFGLPAAVAASHFGPEPPDDPLTLGQFAFEDPSRLAAIPSDAGFAEVQFEEVAMRLGGEIGLEGVLGLLTRTGPASRMLRERGGSEDDRTAMRAGSMAGLSPMFSGPEPGIPSLVKMIIAKAP